MTEAELKSNEINEEILKFILFLAPNLNLFAFRLSFNPLN